MFKGIVAFLLFILIAIAVVVAIILRFMYKGVRNMKEIQEEIINTGGKKFSRQEYIRYQRQQSAKNPFSKDYFKSSDNTKKKQSQAEKQTTTRKTTTDSGVTIIDDRETEEKKKIFDNNDGEYVEFEEVN
jgi:ABC-type lipoprotein release transport system permease subunit